MAPGDVCGCSGVWEEMYKEINLSQEAGVSGQQLGDTEFGRRWDSAGLFGGGLCCDRHCSWQVGLSVAGQAVSWGLRMEG